MKSDLCIFFDPFSVVFTTPSKNIGMRLRDYFSGYEHDRSPDVTIQVNTCGNMPASLFDSLKSFVPTVVGNSFDIGPGIIRGLREPDKKQISIEVHNDFFEQPTGYVFQAFLYLVYYTLCAEHRRQACIIHGCGLVYQNSPFLFIGPHGSGKTTLGLLSGGTIMHDDQMFLRIDSHRTYISSPPLPARDNLRCFSRKAQQIEKIFVLHKDTEWFAKSCTREKSFINVYNEMVLPLRLDRANELQAKKIKLDLCRAVLQSVKIFDLHFSLNDGFKTWLAHERETLGKT